MLDTVRCKGCDERTQQTAQSPQHTTYWTKAGWSALTGGVWLPPLQLVQLEGPTLAGHATGGPAAVATKHEHQPPSRVVRRAVVAAPGGADRVAGVDGPPAVAVAWPR